MPTKKQSQANRQNGRKSRGPKTDAGKRRSALNALKHGLYSHAPVIPGVESENDWEKFLRGVVDTLAPEGPLETAVVHSFAQNLWRIQRARRVESETWAKELRAGTPGEDVFERVHPMLARILSLERGLVRLYRRDLRTLERLKQTARERKSERDKEEAEALSDEDFLKSVIETDAKIRREHACREEAGGDEHKFLQLLREAERRDGVPISCPDRYDPETEDDESDENRYGQYERSNASTEPPSAQVSMATETAPSGNETTTNDR